MISNQLISFKFKPWYWCDLGSFRNDFMMAFNASSPFKRKADAMTASKHSQMCLT
jgi:hypothetical protein